MNIVKDTASGLIWRGVFITIFGVLIAWKPGASAVALAIIWGLFAIVAGIWAFGSAFADDMSGMMRLLLILTGIIGVIAGIIVMGNPVGGAVGLAWAIGIWLIASGLVDIFSAFGHASTPRWLLVLGGVLAIILGVMFVRQPAVGALTGVLTLGIFAIAWGVVLIAAGVQLRGRVKELTS